MLFWSPCPSARRILRTRDRNAALWIPSHSLPQALTQKVMDTLALVPGRKLWPWQHLLLPMATLTSDFWPCRVSTANNSDPPWGPDSASHFEVTRKLPGESWLHQALPSEHTVIYPQKTDMDCEPSGLLAPLPLDWLNAFCTMQHHLQTTKQLLCKWNEARSTHHRILNPPTNPISRSSRPSRTLLCCLLEHGIMQARGMGCVSPGPWSRDWGTRDGDDTSHVYVPRATFWVSASCPMMLSPGDLEILVPRRERFCEGLE